ncbi:MAG: mannosyltransferase family protein [Clostridia bacterium]
MKLNQSNGTFWKRVLFTAVPLFLLLVFYARWVLSNPPESTAALIAATVIAFLFALCGIRFIPQWMAAWSRKPLLPTRVAEGKRSGRFAHLHPFLQIILWLTVFRVSLFIVAYLIVLLRDGYTGGVFDTLELWNHLGLDSQHYLNIAENWYASSGDDRLLIVFMPLYPIVVRLVNYIFQNYLASGLFVSNVCCVFAGYLFYELALLDYDRRTSLRALKYLCILPASFLLSAPLSDSLFLLLSVACVYCMRKNQYLLSGLLGGLAAFTRAPGILLIAPVCLELVGQIIRELPENRHSSRWALQIIGNVCSMLLIPAGLLLYMGVNASVTGNPLMFLTYQQEHWHQQMGWFFATAATQMDNALMTFSGNTAMLWGLWIPNLIYLFASLGIVTAAQNKLRASNVSYFLLYYIVCMGATWLLSAPRYLTACFPLALALGTLTEKKWVDILATIACATMFIAYLYAFANQWYVY